MSFENILSVAQFLCVIFLVPIVAFCFNIGSRVTAIETNIQWLMIALKVTGDNAGHNLHSPHSPEFDSLIEKFWHNALTRNESLVLARKLNEIVREKRESPIFAGEPYSDGQKTAASVMLGVLTACENFQPTNKQTENNK